MAQATFILLFDGLNETALSNKLATICSSLLSTPRTFMVEPLRLDLSIFILMFLFKFNKSLLKSSTTDFTTLKRLIFFIFALESDASSFSI